MRGGGGVFSSHLLAEPFIVCEDSTASSLKLRRANARRPLTHYVKNKGGGGLLPGNMYHIP